MSATEPSAAAGAAILVDAGSDAAPPVAPSVGVSGRRLLAGGSVLGVAMVAANAGNYLLNVLLGRWLSPRQFADANLMVTLMLLITAIAVALQLVMARTAGAHAGSGSSARTLTVRRWLEGRAWLIGAACGVFLAAGSPWLSHFFHSASPVPFVVLGAGLPCYLVQSVGRGWLQGRLEFGRLALTFVAEMLVRLVVSAGLVVAGAGVLGATIGLTASFVATWLVVVRLAGGTREAAEPAAADRHDALATVRAVGVLLAAQIVINNGDVLVAKRALTADRAGVYAVVALIGRAVFFLTWTVATTLFPASARVDEGGGAGEAPRRNLLVVGIGAVLGLGAVAATGAYFMGDRVLGAVFGPEYTGLHRQLATYAVATTLFAVANLVATDNLARGRTREAWVVLGAGVIQTALLVVMSGSLDQLIAAQLVAMSLCVLAVALSHRLVRFASGPPPSKVLVP